MSNKNPILNPLNGETPNFKEEQLQFMEQWFDENAKPLMVVNDGAPINVINVEKFTQFLSLKMFHIRDYHYPTKGEIIEDLEKLHTKMLMNKEIFLYMLNKYVKVPDIKQELKLAFEVFDTEKKTYLDIDELKTIVTTYEEQFDPGELREFLRDANVKGTGYVDYKEFIDRILVICPDLTNLEPKLFLYENPDDDPSVEKQPPEEIFNYITKLMDEEGLTEDNNGAAVEKNDANQAALAEGELLEDQYAQAKSEANAPASIQMSKSDVAKSDVAKSNVAKSDIVKSDVPMSDVAKSDVAKSVAQSTTVAKSEYSDITTEKPPESVKNDDQGYDADVDDLPFANK